MQRIIKINHESVHASVDGSCSRSKCAAGKYTTCSADVMHCIPCTAGLLCRAMQNVLTELRAETESLHNQKREAGVVWVGLRLYREVEWC
jgi:hypothetical protein